MTTPLPVPARLPVAPTVPPPAATPLLAPPEPVTRSPASPSATMIEGSAVGEPQVAQEERASAAVRPTRSLVDREVPAWTPPLNLSSIRECPPLPVEPLPPAADVADAPTRDLPAGTQASPAWSPQGSSLLLPEPARPGEIEIRAVGMPDLAEYVPRPSHPALTTMADATASTASHARQAPTDGWHPPVPATPDRRSVNWRRLIAASILLALLQGVAFAAWWWAQPGVHGTLVVQTAVDGVDILIDGAVVGRTPFRGQVSPGRHKLTLRHGDRRRDMPVEISLGVVTTQALDWPEAAANATGSLQVTSTPTGAEVLVRGVAKGKAPLLLEDLPAGPQPITLRGESGTVTVTATVRPGETIQLDVPIFAGWVVVDSPVELSLLINGTRIGSNMDGQILLSPGSHRLEAVSEALGFRQRFTVTVEPGEVKRVTVRLPTAALQVQDDDGAEVYVDGDRVGALPGNLRIPLGTHDVVIRRRDGGERRQTVTVRAGDTVTIP
ncbi:MAG: PEGA domain-containing protein [Luteitalea sp.]